MSPSPKPKRRPVKTALGNAELIAAYRLLALLQAPFAFGFWRIEQAKANLQDRIDNERSEA